MNHETHMKTTTTKTPSTTGRRQRLKESTRATHEALDQRIMAFNPFASREHYGRFVLAQYLLHRDVQALFDDAGLNTLLPHLSQRSRLTLAEQDLKDLGVAMPEPLDAPLFNAGAPVDEATALGWLYTVEGSNLGAAFLLKRVASLGLDGGNGARHLAPHPDGRAQHWRNFVEQLDEVALAPESEARVDEGADAAFARALQHVQRHCNLLSAPA